MKRAAYRGARFPCTSAMRLIYDLHVASPPAWYLSRMTMGRISWIAICQDLLIAWRSFVPGALEASWHD
jgi:hypothetical protein